MKIPDDAKVVTDKRLTVIKAISQLYDRFVDCEGGLKDKVKAALKAKDATYAQSDLVIARLQTGGKTTADPAKLHALIEAGIITLEQFLSLVTVKNDNLKQILTRDQIAEISSYRAHLSPSLYPDWKPGVVFDADALMTVLEQTLQNASDAASVPVGAKKRRAS